MNHIFLNSVITPKSVEEIKFLILYYDKISIINDAFYTIDFNHNTKEFYVKDIQMLPKNFKENYKFLIDENILDITKRDEDIVDKEFDSKYAESISNTINENNNFLFPKKDGKIILTDEIKDIASYTFNDRDKIPFDFFWWYYAFKLKWSIKLMMEGKTCINSTKNLQNLFENYINKHLDHNLNIPSTNIVKQAITMALPSVDMLSFEDILDLKFRLKEELEAFTDKINSIDLKYKEIGLTGLTEAELSTIYNTEIKNPYNDLLNKMKSLRGKTFTSFIDKAKDINSYIPIIGTFVTSLPLKYALMLSLGIISFETYQQYKKDKEEISNNGLNYLIKLSNYRD